VDNFEIVDKPVPALPDGSVLRRTIYLSLDPYMRGRMSDAPSYAAPVEVGHVMCGHTVSEVVESKNPAFAQGDIVAGYDGWQQFAMSDGRDVRKLDPKAVPIATAISVLGMPGMTAYVGLMDIGQPKPGETVVVSAASGAVGAMVGQLAKVKGCRAIGIAGSDKKCRYIVEELGFDASINYKEGGDLVHALRAVCPKGIDIYFENVGGPVFDAVMRNLATGARIPLCGLISEYNSAPGGGPNLRPLLVHRALIRGFIVSDHMDRAAAFQAECAPLVRDGKIKFQHDIAEGIDAAPSALIGLFEGRNFGKMMVRVSPDPTA
jgi:NADPH-dependent curcumin reductase CurA